jgi:hypothetical protein
MRKLHAVLAAVVLSSCIQLLAQKSIVERCETTPSHPNDSQPIPEQLKIPDAPKTARQVSCFTSFNKNSTMPDVVRKCGIPDKHMGSGFYIFVYYMADCSTVSVITPDLKRLGIRHGKHGKETVLFNDW